MRRKSWKYTASWEEKYKRNANRMTKNGAECISQECNHMKEHLLATEELKRSERSKKMKSPPDNKKGLIGKSVHGLLL